MVRLRLFFEILLPYAAFVALTALGLAWLGGARYEQSRIDSEVARVRAVAESLSVRRALFVTPPAEWRDELRRLAERTRVRLTVIDGQGTPLADSHGDATLLGSFADRPEVRDARRSFVGHDVRLDESRVAVAVSVEDRPASGGAAATNDADRRHTRLGYIRAEGSLDAVTVAVSRWRRRALGLMAVAGVLGLIWAAVTALRLAGPVETFLHSATEMTGSAPPLPALGASETLVPLSAALEQRAGELRHHLEHVRRDSEALRANGERLSAVLTGMAEGVLAVDRHERILFANPAASRLLDLPDGKLAGRPLWEAVRLPAIQEAARAARDGATRQFEIELPRTQTILALQSGYLPGDPSPGVVLVLHDISELRRLENLRREFVGNVSHELKTPLASIQAYTETLLEGGIDDRENNVRFLKRIDEQAERLHHLILDLLRLARIEAGTDVFDITKLTAAKIIEPSVEEHLAIARSKGVTVTTAPPDVPVRLQADPDGLRTIVDNLLDNAINYTPTGGRVAVRWGRQDGMAVIEVSDTGIGIPEEHLPRIFERFHRVDKARSREHGGTGLGLAIVKHLVQVFGGRVEVESEVGRGSTFRVLLPAA